MRRRLTTILGVVLALGLVSAPLSGAAEEEDSGVLTADLTQQVAGDRFIGTVGTFSDADGTLGLDDVSTDLALTGTNAQSYGVVISEDLAAGFNGWQVTAEVCGPTDLLDLGAGPDCTTYPNKLVNLTDPTKELPGDAVQLDDRTVGEVLTAGDSGTLTVDDSGTLPNPNEVVLSGVQELFQNDGQDPGTLYTENYIASGQVKVETPDTGDPIEATTYTGFFVITLIN